MKINPTTARFPRIHLAIFALITAGFVVSGTLYYQELKESIKKEKQSELVTIADFKLQQIGHWRSERYSDAVMVSRDEIAASRIKQWFQNPVLSQDRTDILGWLASIANDGQCRRVYLIDGSGTIRLSAGKSPEEVGPHVRNAAKEALRTRRIFFGDFEREDEEFGVHLNIFAPMYLTRARDTSSVAVILLQVDPQLFFFQLVKSWPIPGRTNEVVLVRREADSIVFLTETNDLKHRPLSLRLPITQNTLPAVKVLKGEEGIIEGVDYAGVTVLAAARRIPDSPWSIVVKVSLEEMYAPLQDRKFSIVIFVGALIIAAGSVIGMVWRHQRALFYRRRYELELERRALEEHYGYATKYANDSILMMDAEGRIIDVNERAILTYGYTHDEFRDLRIQDIQSAGGMANIVETMSKPGSESGQLFKTTHRRKDGSSFLVEVIARAARFGDKIFYQSVVRDVTERVQAEEASKKSEEGYRSLFENMLDGVSYCQMLYEDGHPQDFIYLDVNKAFETLTGLKNVTGKRVSDVIPGFYESDNNLLEIYGQVAMTGKPETFEMFIRSLNEWHSVSAYSPKKEFFIAVFEVITERKRAEEALRESERKWRSLVSHSPDFIALHDREGRYLFLNHYAEGFTEKDVLGKKGFDFVSQESREIYRSTFEECLRTMTTQFAEYSAMGDFEKAKMYESTFVPIISHGDETNVLVIAKDITERKLAEALLRQSKEQLVQFNQHLVGAIENERARISREIHDELGQSLTALKIDLSWLHDHPSLKVETELRVGRMIDIVDNTIRDVQEIASDLRPDILEDLGLVPAIEWYCEEFEKRTDIRCEADLEEIQCQNMQLNLTLFRVMQEALTNVVRHAHATIVNVKLRQTKNDLILEIIDNGIGIDENKIGSNKSIGIIGMRERVRQFNGRLEIASIQPKGTRITVLVQV